MTFLLITAYLHDMNIHYANIRLTQTFQIDSSVQVLLSKYTVQCIMPLWFSSACFDEVTADVIYNAMFHDVPP